MSTDDLDMLNPRPETLYDFMLLSANFAAEKHKNQRRKNKNKTPYINHPLKVAQYISEAGVQDVEIWIGAILHDTVEDTDATLEEIESLFGDRVRNLVDEVSDDKSLSKATRKRLQISHAADISYGAKIIKMADKLHNLSSFLDSPPEGWDARRIQGYFVWSKAVMENCKGINDYLQGKLDFLFDQAVFSLDGTEYPCVPTDVNLEEVLEEYLVSMDKVTD